MTEPRLVAPYTVLKARGVGARADEVLNAGVVLHTADGPLVAVAPDTKRLRALHPDFAALDLNGWSSALEERLRSHFSALPEPTQQHALLSLLARPFIPSEGMGTASLDDGPESTLRELMSWLVLPPARTLRPFREQRRRTSKLVHELRSWLRDAQAYSNKVDDLRHNKVVANYPINPGADLYADFAVLNGRLNAIETLDLRGIERLTSAVRGDAALKGITLDEAREHVDGRRIAVVTASDYGVARPAISLISRYADDVIDLQTDGERQRLVDFIAGALHRQQLPGLSLAS